MQALTTAIVRANRWLAQASATDVVKAVPESYLLGDRALYLFAFDKVVTKRRCLAAGVPHDPAVIF